jgi:hypothetical protein
MASRERLLPSAVRASAPRERGTCESGVYSTGNFHAWNVRLRPYPQPGRTHRGAISLGVEEPTSPAALARWDETGGRVAV